MDDYNTKVIQDFLDSSDVVSAISYAILLHGLGIPEEDRRKLAQDIVEKNSSDFDLTPSSIEEFVDKAVSGLESNDDNFDYDGVYDRMIDDYLAEHEPDNDYGPTGIANPADYMNNSDDVNWDDVEYNDDDIVKDVPIKKDLDHMHYDHRFKTYV